MQHQINSIAVILRFVLSSVLYKPLDGQHVANVEFKGINSVHIWKTEC